MTKLGVFLISKDFIFKRVNFPLFDVTKSTLITLVFRLLRKLLLLYYEEGV